MNIRLSAARIRVSKAETVMLRKVIHLVRTAAFTDEMQAIVGTTCIENLDAIKPADLWSLLSKQGLVPEWIEEFDDGIDLFLGNYDPAKHANLPVVDAVTRTISLTSGLPFDNRARASSEVHPSKILLVVTLTRSIAQYEVIRAIAEGPNQDTIQEMDTGKLWWNCVKVGVPVEQDEQWEPEITIERTPYVPEQHNHLQFVTLPDLMAVEERSVTLADPSRWHHFTCANEKDEMESKRIGNKVEVKANQCYFNARRAIRSLPDYSEATYIEGFIVTENGECFEHGWIVKDGKIIDPTLPNGVKSYFPGLEFTGREGIRQFLSTPLGNRYGNYPFHEAFGWNPELDCEIFLEAFRQAMKCLSSVFGSKAVNTAFDVRAKERLPWVDDWR